MMDPSAQGLIINLLSERVQALTEELAIYKGRAEEVDVEAAELTRRNRELKAQLKTQKVFSLP